MIDPLVDSDDIMLEHLNAYTSELLRCRHVMLFYKERLKLYEVTYYVFCDVNTTDRLDGATIFAGWLLVGCMRAETD